MYDDVSPGEVRRGFFRWLPTALVIIAALAVIGGGLTYAGHKFGWWLANADATRQYQVTQNGTSNQATLRAQVTAKLAEVATTTTLPQMDPNGIYAPSSSSGTFVICVNASGQKLMQYWEGDVMTVTAAATWDRSTHTLKVTGAPTAVIHTAAGK